MDGDQQTRRIIVAYRKGCHTWVFVYDPKFHRQALRMPGMAVVACDDGLFRWSDAATVTREMRRLYAREPEA